MEVTAICERCGDWWAVKVPELPGVFTQAKRLDQVPAMVTDAIATMLEDRDVEVHVTVRAEVPGDARKLHEESEALADQGRALLTRSSTLARRAVDDLRGRGLSVRDVGALLSLSPQRISQLQSGRTVVFTGFQHADDRKTTWDVHVTRHAVPAGSKHRALCGAPLSEPVAQDRPWSTEPGDDEDVCPRCAEITG